MFEIKHPLRQVKVLKKESVKATKLNRQLASVRFVAAYKVTNKGNKLIWYLSNITPLSSYESRAGA